MPKKQQGYDSDKQSEKAENRVWFYILYNLTTFLLVAVRVLNVK